MNSRNLQHFWNCEILPNLKSRQKSRLNLWLNDFDQIDHSLRGKLISLTSIAFRWSSRKKVFASETPPHHHRPQRVKADHKIFRGGAMSWICSDEHFHWIREKSFSSVAMFSKDSHRDSQISTIQKEFLEPWIPVKSFGTVLFYPTVRSATISEFELLVVITWRSFGCKTVYLKIVVTSTSRESHSLRWRASVASSSNV